MLKLKIILTSLPKISQRNQYLFFNFILFSRPLSVFGLPVKWFTPNKISLGMLVHDLYLRTVVFWQLARIAQCFYTPRFRLCILWGFQDIVCHVWRVKQWGPSMLQYWKTGWSTKQLKQLQFSRNYWFSNEQVICHYILLYGFLYIVHVGCIHWWVKLQNRFYFIQTVYPSFY